MKNTMGILLLALFLPLFTGVAQTSAVFQSTNTLPYLLDSVTRNSPYLFRNIRGESRKRGSEKGIFYKSLLTVKDAVDTYIEEKTMDVEWVADYGEAKTIEEAMSMVEALEKQFKTAYPAADFVEVKAYGEERPDYVLVLKQGKSKFYYDVKFSISTVSKKAFGVSCIVTGDKNQSWFIEYIPIEAEPATNQFANDLRMVVQESASGFSTLMGELLSDNGTKEYKATKCIDHAQECTVRKTLFGGGSYVAKLGGGIPESLIEKNAESSGRGSSSCLRQSVQLLYFTRKTNLWVHGQRQVVSRCKFSCISGSRKRK